jgi:hypothetical protein
VIIAFLICSIAAAVLALVALPGLYSYAWETHPTVVWTERFLITVMVTACAVGCVLVLV